MGARESVRDVARNLERFVDAIVARTGPHEVVVELAAQASIPVINGLTLREHPVPGARRHLHDPRAVRAARRASSSPSSATATTSTTRWRCSGRRSGWRSASPIPPATARTSGSSTRAHGAGGGDRRAPGVRPRPGRARPRRRRRLHRRLDLDGPGGRGGGAPRRLRPLPGRRRAARRRRPGRRRDALPAGPPRRGDHVRGHGRPAQPHLGPVGEPAPRPEGAARRAARTTPGTERRDRSTSYERYKEALRRGHVAALRGRLDDRVDAYREAAAIAPDRALPHRPRRRPGPAGPARRGAGGLRAGARPCADATRRALRGRADAPAAAAGGRRPRTRSIGWPASSSAPAACPTPATPPAARSSSPSRASGAGTSRPSPSGCARSAGDAAARRARPRSSRPRAPRSRPTAPAADPSADPRRTEPTEPDRARAAAGARARRRTRRPGAPPRTPLDAGDPSTRRARRCWPRPRPSAAGQLHAAIDACYLALAVAPGRPDLHLMLAELYLDRGWRDAGRREAAAARPPGRADGDPATRERLCDSSSAGSPTSRASRPLRLTLSRPRGAPGPERARCYTRATMPQLLGSILEQVSLTTLVDIGITALLIYWLFSLIRGTRAVRLVIGVSVLFVVYAAARSPSSLQLLTQILQAGAVVGLFALVVVFQPELRRALERIGRVGSFGWLFSPAERAPSSTSPTRSPSAAAVLSADGHGALIVLERETGLEEVAETGVMIHGDVSADLLRTIFAPRPPLHDGAVIIRGETILAAGALLPLAETTIHTERFGTRHRAALGITEQTDAVVVVVSEENGQISLVERARIVRNLNEPQLARAIRSLLAPTDGRRPGRRRRDAAGEPAGTAGRAPRRSDLARSPAAAAPPEPRPTRPRTMRPRRRTRTGASGEPRVAPRPRPQLATEARRGRPRDAALRRPGRVAEQRRLHRQRPDRADDQPTTPSCSNHRRRDRGSATSPSATSARRLDRHFQATVDLSTSTPAAARDASRSRSSRSTPGSRSSTSSRAVVSVDLDPVVTQGGPVERRRSGPIADGPRARRDDRRARDRHGLRPGVGRSTGSRRCGPTSSSSRAASTSTRTSTSSPVDALGRRRRARSRSSRRPPTSRSRSSPTARVRPLPVDAGRHRRRPPPASRSRRHRRPAGRHRRGRRRRARPRSTSADTSRSRSPARRPDVDGRRGARPADRGRRRRRRPVRVTVTLRPVDRHAHLRCRAAARRRAGRA